MRRMPRARRKSMPGRFKSRVGVSQADAHSTPRCLRDQFRCAVEFRRNRDHPNVAASRLPELVECCDSRREQVFRRMGATAYTTDKWALQVNAKRPRSACLIWLGLNGICQALQSCLRRIYRCRDCSWAICGDAVPRKKFFKVATRSLICLHGIVAGRPVDMNINEARRDDAIVEILRVDAMPQFQTIA